MLVNVTKSERQQSTSTNWACIIKEFWKRKPWTFDLSHHKKVSSPTFLLSKLRRVHCQLPLLERKGYQNKHQFQFSYILLPCMHQFKPVSIANASDNSSSSVVRKHNTAIGLKIQCQTRKITSPTETNPDILQHQPWAWNNIWMERTKFRYCLWVWSPEGHSVEQYEDTELGKLLGITGDWGLQNNFPPFKLDSRCW